jgi:hypothetical protein
MSILYNDSPDRDKWIVRSLDDLDHNKLNDSSNTSNTNKKRRIPARLILHLDINETILLGDEAGGDSRRDSVEKMLAKSAFCQLPPSSKSVWEDTQKIEPTHWWDGQPIGKEKTMPPLYTGWKWPENSCPYYQTSFKKFSKKFVEGHHGKVYKPILDECEQVLANSDYSNHILPAFYHILKYLIQLHKEECGGANPLPITLVFRTFGSDIDGVAALLTKFAKANDCPWLELSSEKLFQGRWKECEDGSVVYQLWDQKEKAIVASGDEEILRMLDQGAVFGIRDDYNYWKQNDWYPTAGKPVWIPTYTEKSRYAHHLLFDDNIHNLANDGIACIRKQVDGRYVTVDGESMHSESQGVHLIRVPTVEPVLNPNWYVQEIEKARNLLQERLHGII